MTVLLARTFGYVYVWVVFSSVVPVYRAFVFHETATGSLDLFVGLVAETLVMNNQVFRSPVDFQF